MTRWIYQWMDGQNDKLIDIHIDEWIDIYMLNDDGYIMDGWINGWMDDDRSPIKRDK